MDPVYAMMAYGRVESQLHLILISVTDVFE
jgi:hypothetical protein